ncbi:MAG: SURF1 family protein [Agarilytica sp.]
MSERNKLVFDFNWKLTLCVVFVFPFLVKLSLWQIDRAEEKTALQAQWQSQQAAEPVDFVFAIDYPDYQRVTLSGEFVDEKYWLRESQFYNGKLGFNVVMPFRLSTGDVVAVDRGWVLGSPLRDFLPEVSTPKGEVRISGVLVKPSDSKLIREAEVSAKSWPHKILEVDIAVMSNQAKLKLYGKLLRIDPDSPSAFTVQWKPINMSPAKHYGYSVQWGLLALALIILYFFASTNIAEVYRARFRD